MSDDNANEPAFPATVKVPTLAGQTGMAGTRAETEEDRAFPGLSKRDWLIGQVLPAIIPGILGSEIRPSEIHRVAPRIVGWAESIVDEYLQGGQP